MKPAEARSKADEVAYDKGYRFSDRARDKVLTFFSKCLVHTMGPHAGKPFDLLPWQEELLGQLFGWEHQETGERRYTKADVFCAKKQGKSTLASGLALYFLTTFGNRSQVYGAAYTRDQAAIVYREAAEMARRSPVLRRANLECKDTSKRIVYGDRSSYFQALAGEAGASEGVIASAVIFDEIHVQKTRNLYDSLAYATSACPGAMLLSVSTVGVADQTQVWWEQYDYVRNLLSGAIKDYRRYAFLAQADEECLQDWELCGQLEQWRKAMPSLGHTVTEDTIRQHYTEATNAPAKQNAFKRYLLNLPTQQVDKCIPIELWIKAEAKAVPDDLASRPCFGGLDMASTEDLTCLALYWPGDEERRAYVASYFWAPAAKIEDRVKRGFAFYGVWRDEGHLIVTEGVRCDHKAIQATLRQVLQTYNLRQVGFDKWNADGVVNDLIAEGWPLVDVPQGIAHQTTGCTGLVSDIAEERISHDGNPVMTWCLANAAGKVQDDALKFDKATSADKIDGAVALAMAVGRARANVEMSGSYYENHELEMF